MSEEPVTSTSFSDRLFSVGLKLLPWAFGAWGLWSLLTHLQGAPDWVAPLVTLGLLTLWFLWCTVKMLEEQGKKLDRLASLFREEEQRQHDRHTRLMRAVRPE